jgi:transposase
VRAHGDPPNAIESVSIDMSLACINGVSGQPLNARITFNEFHAISRAANIIENSRRIEQPTDPGLKGPAQDAAQAPRRGGRIDRQARD